jgi:hypothetical protein
VKALRDTLVKLLDAQAVLQWRLRALEGLRHRWALFVVLPDTAQRLRRPTLHRRLSSYQCSEATTDFEVRALVSPLVGRTGVSDSSVLCPCPGQAAAAEAGASHRGPGAAPARV